MKFSIVVPSYNQARFLPACLESILRQRATLPQGDSLEVLVYDGGSTDGSTEILRQAAERGQADPSVKIDYWQSEPDGGQAAAIRSGLARATGDLLGWVNSDDILLPGALAEVIATFRRQPDAAVIYGDALWIDAEGKLIGLRREMEFDWGVFAYGYCCLMQPSVFFRADAYHASGGVDASFHCCMDYDLWHRLLRQGPIRHAKGLWSAARKHGDTKTTLLPARFREEDKRIRHAYVTDSAMKYAFLHPWHRLRRVWLRWRQGCYRPLTENEKTPLGL